MILAGTGHRPDKLGGYKEQVFTRLTDLAVKCLERYAPEKVISGMALGWDQAVAEAACIKSIPWVAAVPFEGQEGKWPEASQVKYRDLIAKATEIVVVCEGGYAAYKMIVRDKWMVDHCDAVLALWNGSDGGTGTTVKYATGKKRIINVWKSWEKFALRTDVPAQASSAVEGLLEGSVEGE